MRKLDRHAVMQAVCDSITYDGDLIEVAARKHGTTGKTVRQWAQEDAELGAVYAQAREMSAESLEQEAIDVARRSSSETYQADRVRIDTLKWAAAKRRPKVYGDKLDVTTDGKALQSGLIALPAETWGTANRVTQALSATNGSTNGNGKHD